MTKMLKVFCSGPEQKELAKQYRIVAAYAAFAVIEATEEQATQIAQSYPVEDITSQYAIQLEDSTIDTSRPRIDRARQGRGAPGLQGGEAAAPGPASLPRAVRRADQGCMARGHQEGEGRAACAIR